MGDRGLVSRETANIGLVSWEISGSCPEVQSPGRQQVVIQSPGRQQNLEERRRVFHIEMKLYVLQRCCEKYNEIWNCLFVNKMKYLNQKLVLEKNSMYIKIKLVPVYGSWVL